MLSFLELVSISIYGCAGEMFLENPEPPTPSRTIASSGTHSYTPDARNADVLVGMRDGVSGRFTLEWRPVAKVSVLDSGFVLGDGVWEGIRVHKGVIMFARVRLLELQPH